MVMSAVTKNKQGMMLNVRCMSSLQNADHVCELLNLMTYADILSFI